MDNTGKSTMTKNLKRMTRIALFAAVFCVMAQIYIPLPFSPVPITMQTLGIMLCAVVLPPFEAVCAAGLYTFMGIIGLPVFAGFTGGIGRLAGPTGGFIIGWFPAVWLMSAIITRGITGRKGLLRYIEPVTGIIVFTLVLYGFGLTWFMLVMGVSFYQAFLSCALPFIPGDTLKGAVVVLTYPAMMALRVRVAR